MKITIVGAGRVGLHLAKYFSDEHQEVFLMDDDSDALAAIESDYNMRTFAGSPLDIDVLREAGADKADVFVAVTASTADNLVACSVAKALGAKKTIARVDNYGFIKGSGQNVLRGMGVDHVVFPDLLAARAIVSSLQHPWCRGWNEFDNGAIIMAAVQIAEDAPIAGKYLRELFSESRILHVSALKRNHVTLIPRGDDMILPGDILYFTAVAQGIDKVMQLSGKPDFRISNIIMMGGSTAAGIVANMPQANFNCVIVEKDLEHCRRLTQTCHQAQIIYGDAGDIDVLDEAGIGKCDAFIALSDNTENNILSCLTAADMGVKFCIAEVEKERLIDKAESFHISSVINKPILTANAIFQLVLDSDMTSSKCFALADAEVARMKIAGGTYLTEHPVMELKIPAGVTFAGLIRNGQGLMVTGATRFTEGDHVIVFCLKGSLDKVEKLFRR